MGPSGRPARSVSSVLPFAVGKADAFAVGAGSGGGLLLEPELPQPATSTARPRKTRERGRGTGGMVGSVVQSALNQGSRGGTNGGAGCDRDGGVERHRAGLGAHARRGGLRADDRLAASGEARAGGRGAAVGGLRGRGDPGEFRRSR